MRESYFCKLQQVSLAIAKRNPGENIHKMQEILISKQKEEETVDD